MVLLFDGWCCSLPFPFSAIEQLLWEVPRYETWHKSLLESGVIDYLDIVRIAEEVQGNHQYEFEASPMHATHIVKKEGIEWIHCG